MSPMNFQVSPRAKEDRLSGCSPATMVGTLLITDIHSFWELHWFPTNGNCMQGLHPTAAFLIFEPPLVFINQKKKLITATLGLSQFSASVFLLACIELLQLKPRGGTEMPFLFWIPKQHMSSKSDTSTPYNGFVLSTTSHISWMCWTIIRGLLIATANLSVRPYLQERKLF